MEKKAGAAPIEILWRAQTIKTHAAQCAQCGKYRAIPSKKVYESIRETIFRQPWVCADAKAWEPGASCELPDDFVGKSKFVLTMDRPGLPRTPAGWERSVHIRAGPGNEHFSDIFYFAPGQGTRSSRRLRSLRGVEKYVAEFPEARPPAPDLARVFSFARPRPPPKFNRKSLQKMKLNERTVYTVRREEKLTESLSE